MIQDTSELPRENRAIQIACGVAMLALVLLLIKYHAWYVSGDKKKCKTEYLVPRERWRHHQVVKPDATCLLCIGLLIRGLIASKRS